MGRGEEVTGGELLLQDGDFLKNLGQSGRKTLHHLVFYVLVVGECRKMPVMRCIIPSAKLQNLEIRDDRRLLK